MDTMLEQIRTTLRRIEEEEQVRIVYACESGSRAWGFPSRDSDYDVRFLYVRSLDDYVSLFEPRDVIERPISDLLDVNGWDLRKALRLFCKSNPPLLEWLESPIVYEERYGVAEAIRQLSPLSFSPKSCMYHYLSMAKGNYREYLQGERVELKKYFYVLRPLLACAWIERYETMPPMAFDTLTARLLAPDSALYAAVARLLERKKAGEELDDEPRIDEINAYLENRILYYEAVVPRLGVAPGSQEEALNALLRSGIRTAWNER